MFAGWVFWCCYRCFGDLRLSGLVCFDWLIVVSSLMYGFVLWIVFVVCGLILSWLVFDVCLLDLLVWLNVFDCGICCFCFG